MEVLRRSFEKTLPLIAESIESAGFIAIDAEFSGLVPYSRLYGGESDRYSKIREAVQLYRAIQIGLTAVKPNPSSATGFSSRSFNFYVLPPSGCTITWNTDAMGFLTSHGFEYNKLAREGIPYLNRTQEAQRFKRNKDPMKARQERGFTTVIDLLISARKPIVGHNMFFDLAFIYQQFIDPLPSSLSTYSQRLSKYFPEIYDTKVLATSTGVANTRLNDLYLSSLMKWPGGVDHDDGFTRYKSFTPMNSDPLSRAGDSLPEDESSWNDVFRQALDATREGLSLESVELLQHSDPNFDHEAGFDSFMTASSFIYLKDYLDNAEDNVPLEFWKNQLLIPGLEMPYSIEGLANGTSTPSGTASASASPSNNTSVEQEQQLVPIKIVLNGSNVVRTQAGADELGTIWRSFGYSITSLFWLSDDKVIASLEPLLQ